MCVAFWSLEHPDYALILCSNRDEYLARPTADAHFHLFNHEAGNDTKDGPVLSGRDTRAGGTWFGVNHRSGRVALLTNITETPMKEFTTSRGHLVSSFLLSESSSPLDDEISNITPRDAKYAGFNLLLLAPSSSTPLTFDASLVTNNGEGGTIRSRALSDNERRFGGLSNGILGHGANEWHKVQHGIEYLKTSLPIITPETKKAEVTERLFELLNWRPPVGPVPDLEDTICVDPILRSSGAPGTGPELYGTRLSTVLIIRRNGEGLFIERDAWKLAADGKIIKGDDPRSDRIYRFQLQLGRVS